MVLSPLPLAAVASCSVCTRAWPSQFSFSIGELFVSWLFRLTDLLADLLLMLLVLALDTAAALLSLADSEEEEYLVDEIGTFWLLRNVLLLLLLLFGLLLIFSLDFL